MPGTRFANRERGPGERMRTPGTDALRINAGGGAGNWANTTRYCVKADRTKLPTSNTCCVVAEHVTQVLQSIAAGHLQGGRTPLMTNIVVLIKQVPDTWSERKLTDGDYTLDREAADAVLDEINERAVEEALLIKEKEAANGTESTVTVLTAGPQRATEAIRKALSMGADKAVHLLDDGMHGSDLIQTGWALAPRLGSIGA